MKYKTEMHRSMLDAKTDTDQYFRMIKESGYDFAGGKTENYVSNNANSGPLK